MCKTISISLSRTVSPASSTRFITIFVRGTLLFAESNLVSCKLSVILLWFLYFQVCKKNSIYRWANNVDGIDIVFPRQLSNRRVVHSVKNAKLKKAKEKYTLNRIIRQIMVFYQGLRFIIPIATIISTCFEVR